jgi:hypothetical protein
MAQLCLNANHQVNCCNQALAQACAFVSPFWRSISEMAILRQLPTEKGKASVIFHGGRKEMEGAIHGLVEHPDKFALLLLDCRAHLIFCGGGFDVHRENVWTVWSWFGLSRQGTD